MSKGNEFENYYASNQQQNNIIEPSLSAISNHPADVTNSSFIGVGFLDDRKLAKDETNNTGNNNANHRKNMKIKVNKPKY